MSFGSSASRRREASRKHALHEHKCRCGRIINGNAYYQHRKSCPCYRVWRAHQDARQEVEKSLNSTKDAYIPMDLEDCFVRLKKIVRSKDIEKLKNGNEDDMGQCHFGLGMWMRNNWGLWGSTPPVQGSRLAKWFNEQGVRHPDDMSGIILTSFWRHLNNRPIDLCGQVKYYRDYWSKLKVAQSTIIDKEIEKKKGGGIPFQ